MVGFPNNVINAARDAQVKWKVPAAVTLAQWALESGFGKHMPAGSNNPFGIKAGPGEPYVEAITHEDIHERYVTVVAKFCKFSSLSEAFEAHAELIAKSPVYAPAMRCCSNPEQFAIELTHRYATDPNYGSKLIELMREHHLETYDI